MTHGDPISPPELIDAGVLLGPEAFADRLGWTPQQLADAVATNRVFYVSWKGAQYYPAWYGDAQYDRGQLEAVSQELGDLPGGAKVLFFLTAKGSLNRLTPLQALALGKLAAVKVTAAGFAQR